MVTGLTTLLLLLGQPAKPPHIGSYVPNSQLLSWCKSQDKTEFAICWSFISGVIESSGMTDAEWPRGPIQLPLGLVGHHMIPAVTDFIEQLGPEKMSSPAARSVYEAVVAIHPYRAEARGVKK